MKKKLAVLLVVMLVAVMAFAACGQTTEETPASSPSEAPSASQSTAGEIQEAAEPSGEQIELTVFAAASMTETLEEIADSR